ncbi:MAG: glycosyltransferase family 4 protein [Elusimicrobia bacterium]|nr:glycosyltransferase family 4 protein [Elusimicrobiota bacterium]
MKIAIVYDAVYPYVIGGAEKRNWEIAKRLAAKGHDVSLVGMKFWKGSKQLISESVQLKGICPAISLYNRNGKRSFIEPFYFGLFCFFHFLKNKYDIIDCSNFPYFSAIAIFFALLLKRSKTKFVITWHEVWGKKYWKEYIGFLGYFGYLIEKISSNITRNNIVNSLFTKKRLIDLLGNKSETIELIPNGINFGEIDGILEREKENQIIYVGRLIKYKNVDILIDVVKDLINDEDCRYCKNIILKIVGDGPEKQKLSELAVKHKIEKHVIFSGFLDKEELFHELKRSKIFVLPSDREGFGITVIESMALGTPVIARDSEYSALKSLIISGKNGILFKSKEELVLALKNLLIKSNIYDTIVREGFEFAEKYDWDKYIIPKLISCYEKVLNNKSLEECR